MELQPLSAARDAEVEALLDAAFGSDRRGRTAYAIRGPARAIAAFSFASIVDGALLGSIQCFPVQLRHDEGGATPLVMVGPVAIRADCQGQGHGRALMAASLGAARAAGVDALMLIGDPDYYGQFGFTAARTALWRAPGPVERHRLLALGDGAPDVAGMLGPA
ncbi:MAG: N-acetyltransferase [Sphingomonas sp.]|nr:N-acetyltransferase [Sphingomonas sp.]